MLSPDDDTRPALRPPQFRLRTLLLSTAGFCIFFALIGWMSPMAVAAAILFLLCVFAHLAGASLGTQLRENGGGWKAKETTPVDPARFAPASRLSRSSPPGLWIIISTIVGAVLGGGAGGVLLAWLYWDHLIWSAALFGFLSTGVIGGVAAFSASSFFFTLFSANLEAVRESGR